MNTITPLLVAMLVVGCTPASTGPSVEAPAPPRLEPVREVAAAPPVAPRTAPIAKAPPAAPIAKAPPAAPIAKAPPAASAAKAPVAQAPAPAKATPAPPTLDLASLEERLKGSDAIGIMTKLSLKNQVGDLVKQFRAYHDGSRPPQLKELRPAYELLLMKVLSLLQDKDVALAKDINASREAIWGVLADREKLARFA